MASMETMVRVALMENGVTATDLSRRLGRCQRYVSTRLPRIKEEECARWLDLVLEIVEEREKQKKEKEDERRKEEAHVRQMLGSPLEASGMDDEGAVKLVESILAIELDYVKKVLYKRGRYAAIRELESNWAFAYTGADAEDLVSALEARKGEI